MNSKITINKKNNTATWEYIDTHTKEHMIKIFDNMYKYDWEWNKYRGLEAYPMLDKITINGYQYEITIKGPLEYSIQDE
jgi:hypothetical protein